jgi:hypothetical protein
LYIDINKYKFKITRVKYLRLILTIEGIKIDPNKVKAV